MKSNCVKLKRVQKIQRNIGLPDLELHQFENIMLRILVLLRNSVLRELFLTFVFESILFSQKDKDQN